MPLIVYKTNEYNVKRTMNRVGSDTYVMTLVQGEWLSEKEDLISLCHDGGNYMVDTNGGLRQRHLGGNVSISGKTAVVDVYS